MDRRGAIESYRPLDELDLKALVDDSELWKNTPNWKVQFVDEDVEEIRKLIQAAGFCELGKVVDVGSGFGRISVFLAECNEYVVGVDRNAGGVQIGNHLTRIFNLPGLSFQKSNSESLPIETGSVDGVWFYTALQFMHRGQALAEARRILKPEGRLFVGRYNTTWVIIEKYLFGFQNGGRESTQCNWVRRALTNGPAFDGGANWLDLSSAKNVIMAHGFEVYEPCGVKVSPGWDMSFKYFDLFQEPAELIKVLDADDSFVEDLIEQQDIFAKQVPGDVQIIARKI